MTVSVTNSEFYMWRTVFAVSHADGVVTDEEIRFMAEVLEDQSFSEEQKEILKDDIHNPKDPTEMFEQIGDVEDQAKFFEFARELVWIDGDFGGAEQKVMVDLIGEHIKTVDFEKLVQEVDLGMQLETPPNSNTRTPVKRSFIQKIFDFLLGR